MRFVLFSFIAIGLAIPAFADPVKDKAPATLKKTKLPPEREPSLPPGALINVTKYDEEADIYFVDIVNEPGVGPNRASPEDLAIAIKSLKIESLKKKPNDVVGNQFQIDQPLKLFTDLGVAKRKKSLKK